MERYYNSIQDGVTCPSCFNKMVALAKARGDLVALSEKFRFGSAEVLSRVVDHIEGINDPFDISDGYVDRAILKVVDDDTREIIIISNNGDPSYCLGYYNQPHE